MFSVLRGRSLLSSNTTNEMIIEGICLGFFLLQLASGIYNFTCSLWNHHTDTFLQQIGTRDETAISNALERTLLTLKGNYYNKFCKYKMCKC